MTRVGEGAPSKQAASPPSGTGGDGPLVEALLSATDVAIAKSKLKAIQDPSQLAAIASNAQLRKVAELALARLSDQSLIARVATTAKDVIVAKDAAKKLTDPDLI